MSLFASYAVNDVFKTVIQIINYIIICALRHTPIVSLVFEIRRNHQHFRHKFEMLTPRRSNIS